MESKINPSWHCVLNNLPVHLQWWYYSMPFHQLRHLCCSTIYYIFRAPTYMLQTYLAASCLISRWWHLGRPATVCGAPFVSLNRGSLHQVQTGEDGGRTGCPHAWFHCTQCLSYYCCPVESDRQTDRQTASTVGYYRPWLQMICQILLCHEVAVFLSPPVKECLRYKYTLVHQQFVGFNGQYMYQCMY